MAAIFSQIGRISPLLISCPYDLYSFTWKTKEIPLEAYGLEEGIPVYSLINAFTNINQMWRSLILIKEMAYVEEKKVPIFLRSMLFGYYN